VADAVHFVRFLIVHLDSAYGFISKLESSPDWKAKLTYWGIE